MLETGAELTCDLAIVGAGAAGIALARAFAGGRLRVCLLESGDLGFDPDLQALYHGTNSGLPYYELDAARLRYFGGTTNHWTGRCVPLDPIDFESRAWLPHSGWPLTYAALEPFYRRAQAVCQLGPYEYWKHFWYGPDKFELPVDPTRLRHDFWQTRPLAFGTAYHAELEAAANVEVLFRANVVGIVTNDALQAVERLDLATLEGSRFTCRARAYVLACGGLETPRLLLASNHQAPAGLGNQHDLVGRFFMEHPVVPVARAVVAEPSRFATFFQYEPSALNPELEYLDVLRIAPEQIRRHEILNVAWRLYEDPANDRENGFAALRRLLLAARAGELPERLGSDLWQTLFDLDDAVAGLMGEVGLSTYDYVSGTCQLRTISEQAPNPDSRVRLSTERDALVMPLIELDWRLSALDRHTLEVASKLLAQEFGRAGIARVQLASWLEASEGWPDELVGSYHHMGTTRMSADPKAGVVDGNCRVHGLANLYIAGSAVFPTSGWANPTLTIVALTLRLSDHLEVVLAG